MSFFLWILRQYSVELDISDLEGFVELTRRRGQPYEDPTLRERHNLRYLVLSLDRRFHLVPFASRTETQMNSWP